MKRLIFPLFLSLFFMCSWVDPDTVDVYNGFIVFDSSSQSVTQLGGSIQFYLSNNIDFGLTDSGTVFNSTSGSVSGRALLNGIEYAIQFTSFGELQIQQTYIQNNTQRNIWVNYNLYMDQLPSSFNLSEFAPIMILFLLFTIVPLSLYKGVLQ